MIPPLRIKSRRWLFSIVVEWRGAPKRRKRGGRRREEEKKKREEKGEKERKYFSNGNQ